MPTARPRPRAARPTVAAVSLVALTTLTAAACGGDDTTTTRDDDAPDGFPLTVQNCGVDVTFDAPPERVVLLESAPVTILDGLGVLDSVALRAGAFPQEYYDDETFTQIEEIPSLGEDLDDDGHLQISSEVIINEQPDLVFGLPDGLTRQGLADAGIQVLEQPVYCPSGVEATSFDDIYEQVELYGQIFGRQDEAAVMVEDLRGRVEEVRSAAQDTGEDRTAAVLFPTVGGGSGWAYGSHSMAHPQLEAAGFTNVFGDVDDRVFEVTLEQLISRDPDVLVLLHVDGEPGPVKDAVVNLQGAEALTAVRNDDILVQLFNFTEPPTPVSIDGLERIADRFGGAE